LGRAIGVLYGGLLLQNGFSEKWDVIVPVPLHRTKLKRRGYNQSEMFAEGLSKAMQIPVGRVLHRNTHTQTQTKKTRLQRWENVSEVFCLETVAMDCKGKRILLVDDVMTTGATLAACANVLKRAQPSKVDLAVIAAGK
jgi:ComF family protein